MFTYFDLWTLSFHHAAFALEKDSRMHFLGKWGSPLLHGFMLAFSRVIRTPLLTLAMSRGTQEMRGRLRRKDFGLPDVLVPSYQTVHMCT